MNVLLLHLSHSVHSIKNHAHVLTANVSRVNSYQKNMIGLGFLVDAQSVFLVVQVKIQVLNTTLSYFGMYFKTSSKSILC